MQINEKTLREIQEKAGKMSDFLRMEYLESAAEKIHEVDVHRFCYLELSRLYESRKMYSDAIKYVFKYQETLISQEEKNKAMMKEIELLIRGGNYEKADSLVRKLMEHVKEREKFEVIRRVIEVYKQEAVRFEKENSYSRQEKVYEKMIPYMQDPEKTESRRRLLVIYKKLGKIRESFELEKSLERNLV
ncbi:MAG: hypothetical protein AABX29_03675 [Nanoarchaeota archaeon]